MRFIGGVVFSALFVIGQPPGVNAAESENYHVIEYEFSEGAGAAADQSFDLDGALSPIRGLLGSDQYLLDTGFPAVFVTPSAPTAAPTSPSVSTAPTAPAITSPKLTRSATISSSPSATESSVTPTASETIATLTPTTVPVATSVASVAPPPARSFQVFQAQFTEITNEVVVPVTVGTGAVAVASVGVQALGAIGSAGGVGLVGQLWTLLMLVWNAFLEAIGLRKKRYPWGTVFDIASDHPVELAIVRLLDQDGKLVETRVTDRAGRFGFLVSPGTYRIEVKKAGFHQVDSLEAIGTRYQPVYDGRTVVVDQVQSTLVTNIGLRQEGRASHFLRAPRQFLSSLYRPALVLTLLLAIWNAIVLPGLITALVLVTALLVFASDRLLLTPKNVGEVVDDHGEPIPNYVLRLIRARDQKPIAAQVTDEQGRFSFLALPGDYYLSPVTAGWKPPRWVTEHQLIHITNQEGAVIHPRIRLHALPRMAS